jgi:hypothetical protein
MKLKEWQSVLLGGLVLGGFDRLRVEAMLNGGNVR